MQNQFNEAAARASAHAVTSVEALILALSMRLGMLRNTIAALTLAAYERPDDMARLYLPSILESLTALLPDDDAFTAQLAPVADAFMSTLMQAAEAERQRAVPPELLARIIEVMGKGSDANMDELDEVSKLLVDAINTHAGYGEALSAFYDAVKRNGVEVSSGVVKGKPFHKFERASTKAKPKAPVRKRDRLVAA